MQIDTKPVILLFIFIAVAVNKLIPDHIAGRSQWEVGKGETIGEFQFGE